MADIGIGLPATIPGVDPGLIVDWARKADEGPFSSLGALDRVVYPNFEPLVALAASAAVTRRIKLMTTILIAPIRNGGMLAKQTASIHALSGGRLSLGLAVGGRADDFAAAPARFNNRGRRFDEQLALMKRVWAGEPANDDAGQVGPPLESLGAPEILIGAFTPQAIDRVGRWGDGFIVGGVGPDIAKGLFDAAQKSWSDHGRSGKPRFVAGMYFALGDEVAVKGSAYIKDYYQFMGPTVADQAAGSLPTTPEAIKNAISGLEGVGVDEIVLWPSVAELEQVDRLAEVVG